MPIVQPPAPRYRIEDLEDGIKITIPSRRHWVGIFIAAAYLPLLWFLPVGALASFVSQPPKVSNAADGAGLLIFLPFLFLMAAFALYLTYSFLWILIGKEIILVRPGSLTVQRRVWISGRCKEYLAEHIRDLRVSPPSPWSGHVTWMYDLFLGMHQGQIAFDYGAKTFHIGTSADEAEAKQIVAAIQQRFPQYADTHRAAGNTEHPK